MKVKLFFLVFIFNLIFFIIFIYSIIEYILFGNIQGKKLNMKTLSENIYEEK